MQKTSIWGVIVISIIFLFSSYALADSFSFSWSSGEKTEPRPTVVKDKKNGPPPHAPAHGYRSKRQYKYYPSTSVYHDTNRGLYFYLSGSGWQIAASLPENLKMRLGSSVTMEMDTDKPYIYNDQHRKQYPPGQLKKKKHMKGKKWAKK